MRITVALSAVAGLLLLPGSTLAHTIFSSLNSGPIGQSIRIPNSNNPTYDVTSEYMACNGGDNPTTPSSNVATVQAGSSVSLTWRHTQQATEQNDPDYVIASSHHGPVQAYMKKVSDATSDPGCGDGWFKIAADGYSNGAWGVDRLIAAGGVQNVTIPACIAPGQYLLRGEIIALHNAETQGGAQFFMECAQINVVGGAGTSSPSTVAIPGAYSATDPGILINIYQTIDNYTIPGPDCFTC